MRIYKTKDNDKDVILNEDILSCIKIVMGSG